MLKATTKDAERAHARVDVLTREYRAAKEKHARARAELDEHAERLTRLDPDSSEFQKEAERRQGMVARAEALAHQAAAAEAVLREAEAVAVGIDLKALEAEQAELLDQIRAGDAELTAFARELAGKLGERVREMHRLAERLGAVSTKIEQARGQSVGYGPRTGESRWIAWVHPQAPPETVLAGAGHILAVRP